MPAKECLSEVEIQAVEDVDDDIGAIFLHLGFLIWLLVGMTALKGIELLQLSINRLFGWIAHPQDKDVHMHFFLSTLYVWLHFVSLSRLFLWFRLVISDGEAVGLWTDYRALIQKYGLEKFLRDSNAILIDDSRYGQLYRKPLSKGEEPIMLLCVYDSTVGPSGVPSRYFLRVPPYVRTAKEAVAWTFGMSWREYSPSIET